MSFWQYVYDILMYEESCADMEIEKTDDIKHRSGQIGRCFADNICKCISLKAK